MANFDAQPVNTGTSASLSFTSQVRVAAPFTEANMTWIEVENSTGSDWAGFNIQTTLNQAGIMGMFLVATGAASSEVMNTVIPITTSYRDWASPQFIPIPIASGTRVAVAASCNFAATVYCQIVGVLSSNFDSEPNFTKYYTGPYNLTNTSADYGKWVELDPGATVNTKSSYIEISQTSHTANVLNGDSLGDTYTDFGFIIGDNFNTANRLSGAFVDVAVGAVSSEVIWAADIHSLMTVNEQTIIRTPLIVPTTDASAASRWSARIQCGTNDDPDRKRSILLFGVL